MARKRNADQGTASDPVKEFYRRIGHKGVEVLHDKLRRGEIPLPPIDEEQPRRT